MMIQIPHALRGGLGDAALPQKFLISHSPSMKFLVVIELLGFHLVIIPA
jgi:hypothetical protein